MASTNNYINEYATLDEMNAAYETDHSGSWVAYCAEDNNLYYQQKTSISSKYFDNLEYNSANKTLDFYIDGEVKKSIDVSPWWFEKDSYYTREETNNLLLPKFDNVVYDSSARTINFYSGTEVKKTIDATDFIKDGMVDNVQVVVSSDTKSYLEITFNTDSEGQKTHDTVYLDLTKIFNPENYYTKSDSDGKYVTGLGTDNKSLTYTINGNSTSLPIPYATSANTTPWSGITDTPTTVQGYGIIGASQASLYQLSIQNQAFIWGYMLNCIQYSNGHCYKICDIDKEIKSKGDKACYLITECGATDSGLLQYHEIVVYYGYEMDKPQIRYLRHVGNNSHFMTYTKEGKYGYPYLTVYGRQNGNGYYTYTVRGIPSNGGASLVTCPSETIYSSLTVYQEAKNIS